MPWKVSGVVEKRKEFLADYGSGDWTMSDLCVAYGITRPTGYAVLRRQAEDGEAGLEERSRAPRRHRLSRHERRGRAFGRWHGARLRLAERARHG